MKKWILFEEEDEIIKCIIYVFASARLGLWGKSLKPPPLKSVTKQLTVKKKLAAVLVTVATTEEHSCKDLEKKIHMTALLQNIPSSPTPRIDSKVWNNLRQESFKVCTSHAILQLTNKQRTFLKYIFQSSLNTSLWTDWIDTEVKLPTGAHAQILVKNHL